MFRGFVYAVTSEYAYGKGQLKLGLTIHPVHRMRQYDTGDAPDIGLEKFFGGLYLTNATDRKMLRKIEAALHKQFEAFRRPKKNGRKSEWFSVTYEQVAEFLSTCPYIIKRIPDDEISAIQTKADQLPTKEECIAEKEDALEEKDWSEEQQKRLEEPTQESIQEHIQESIQENIQESIQENIQESIQENIQESITPPLTLYVKFLQIFLRGRQPRRVQAELWTLFATICNTPEDICYKGIIQWPTGVGKTIAILMLIVIAKDRCERRGVIYRGLFVSPKNDIIDTISIDFNKLSEFGITVYDGAHGKLSSLTIPTNCHIMVSACQAALINDKGMRRLPNMSHVHYDEVHRITGELYFKLLKEMLIKWNTEFLTGTSATPKTCSKSQHDKLAELFGEPYTILHKCDVEEAVKEEWIAVPRYVVSITPKNNDRAVELDAFLVSINKTIAQKKEAGHWRGGKVIAFSPDSVEDVRYLANHATEQIPGALIYSAIDGQRTDEAFIKAPADGTVRILFACQRFREGSDVKGLDMTCALVGNTTAVYILLQMCGRALRLDYEGKEGWCLIVRPSDQGTTEEDVLASIILDIIEFLGDSNKKREVKEIEPLIKTFLGEVSVSGSSLSLEETIKRVQAAYVRREFTKRTPREKYSLVREVNQSLGIHSRSEYFERSSEHSKFVENPKLYFEGLWVSWYHFLGVDTSSFPQTKSEWVRVCKDMGFTTWDLYKQKNITSLPMNPGEMYEDYTNWHKEFDVEEDIVW